MPRRRIKLSLTAGERRREAARGQSRYLFLKLPFSQQRRTKQRTNDGVCVKPVFAGDGAARMVLPPTLFLTAMYTVYSYSAIQ